MLVFRVRQGGGGMNNDQTTFIPLSTYTKMYNSRRPSEFCKKCKTNQGSGYNDVESSVKQIRNLNITLHERPVKILLETELGKIWETYRFSYRMQQPLWPGTLQQQLLQVRLIFS